jgi:threonine dehydratase
VHDDVEQMAALMSIADVRAAGPRIAEHIITTPTLRAPVLDALAGCELWLKAENLQRVGAFKARGAMHTVARLSPEARARGLITYSSGNHAQAVALAAQTFGVRAWIAMPTDAPAIKQAGVRRLGGEIMFAGTTSEHRRAAAQELQARTGGVIIEPFDHPDIIAGQGTATLELLEQVAAATGGARLDALIVPVGGGGLIAGACLVCEHFKVPVYSAEPTTCDALARSLAAGERVAVEPGPTLGDGLKPTRVGALNFEIARRAVHGSLQVDDHALGRALVRLLVHAKVLVEPSGAAALAAAMKLITSLPRAPQRVGVILSGGNVSPALVSELLVRHGEET